MKKLILLFLAVMLLTACGQAKENDQGAVYMIITAEEAKRIMDSEEGYIILDVRTREEYDEGHIPGATQISHEEIAEKAEDVLTDKDQLILVYCHAGPTIAEIDVICKVCQCCSAQFKSIRDDRRIDILQVVLQAKIRLVRKLFQQCRAKIFIVQNPHILRHRNADCFPVWN